MSLTIFIALSILSCDFLLIVLFQWVYGEKRRLRQIRSLRQSQRERKSPKLHLVRPNSAPPSAGSSLAPSTSAPPSTSPATPIRAHEQLAHRRIVASLVPTRARF